MKFKHTAQVAFQIKDMEAALRFYCQGLGLRQKFARCLFAMPASFFRAELHCPASAR